VAASASQEEVFEAASALGLSLKLGVGKSFEADLAWLGPVRRSEADVRDALGRLSDPPRRAAERLFWFGRALPLPRPATLDSLRRECETLVSEGGPAEQHDAALLLLAALHALDPQFSETALWAEAFRLWHEVVAREEFWSWLVAADLKGEFEQALTFGEAAALRAETPRLVSKTVADAAQAAAVAENFERCGRAFVVLRAASLPPALLHEYENEILGPVEEQAEEACDSAFVWARLFAHGADMAPATRKRYFDESLYRFDREARPALLKLYTAAGPESFHLRRVLRHAAAGLAEVAGSYRAEAWTAQAAHVYGEARALAPPGSAEAEAAEEGLRALGAGEGLAGRDEEAYAASLAAELRGRPRPEKLFERPLVAQAASGTFRGCLPQIIFYLIVAAVGFTIAWLGAGRPRRSSGLQSLNALNINYRMPLPQFTPFPVPALRPDALGLPQLKPAELQQRMRRRQVVVIDVRPRAEFEAGHVAGALSVPEEEVEDRAAALRRRGRQVVCYGSSANPYRSVTAALALRIGGLRNVAVLEGDFEAWVAAGLPTEAKSVETVEPPAAVGRGVTVAPAATPAPPKPEP
jgi:rhodanese-related sulfurtransferase